MKKIFYSMLALLMAASTFTSCEDVPAPYADPNAGGGGQPELPEGIIFQQDFTSSLGDFTSVSASGDLKWYNDFKSAMITGYSDFDGDGTKENKAGVTYFVSPEIDLNVTGKAHITLVHALNYERADINTNNALLISKDYNGDVNTATWESLPYNTDGLNTSFTFVESSANIPDSYLGGKVVVALRHTCTDKQSSTWEVQKLTIEEGEAEVTPENPDKPSDGVYIDEAFSENFGSFTEKTVKGTPWVIDFKTAKATGYDNSSKVTTPSESYLVSSPIDLSSSKGAFVSFEYILRYVTNNGNPVDGVSNKVLVTDNYTGDPSSTNWTDITGTLTEGRDWTTFSKYSVDLPAAFIGKKNVVVALYYSCAEKSGTWEVKNFKLQEGKADNGGENPGGGETGDGFVVDVNSFGLDNAADLTQLTLSDGTTLAFDAGGNKNGPKFYQTGGGAFRMYPQNSVEVSSKKNIESITIVCDEYNGTTYNASGDLNASAGKLSTADKTVTVSGVAGKTVKISNVSTTTGAGSQLRIKSMTIYYAK